MSALCGKYRFKYDKKTDRVTVRFCFSRHDLFRAFFFFGLTFALLFVRSRRKNIRSRNKSYSASFSCYCLSAIKQNKKLITKGRMNYDDFQFCFHGCGSCRSRHCNLQFGRIRQGGKSPCGYEHRFTVLRKKGGINGEKPHKKINSTGTCNPDSFFNCKHIIN